MFVSIIIPTLDEEMSIKALLQQLQIYREQGHEIIVVDGGSCDNTISIAESLSDKTIKSEAGRALQMNAGALVANHQILWFLHADSFIPDNAAGHIQKALNTRDWGRFNVRLSGTNFIFRIIEKMMNCRSCFTGIATGDQAIFVNKNSFEKVGGYPSIPLMEDIELSHKLKALSKPFCIKDSLITSSRRWEKNGIFSTVLLMWRLRFLYWMGVSANKLVKLYK